MANNKKATFPFPISKVLFYGYWSFEKDDVAALHFGICQVGRSFFCFEKDDVAAPHSEYAKWADKDAEHFHQNDNMPPDV